MKTFDHKRADELLALDSERTAGRWEVHRPRKKIYIRNLAGIYILEQTQAGIRTDADAAFIATAPEIAEQLRLAVAEVERLEAQVEFARTAKITDQTFRPLKECANPIAELERIHSMMSHCVWAGTDARGKSHFVYGSFDATWFVTVMHKKIDRLEREQRTEMKP